MSHVIDMSRFYLTGVAISIAALAGCGEPEVAGWEPAAPELKWVDGKPPVRSADDLLTVEQTVAAVFWRGYIEESGADVYSRANPEAKEHIRKILRDEGQRRYHARAWRLLGYIGDGTDVSRMNDRLHELSGPLMGFAREEVSAMFDALGLMSARDVPEAKEAVDQMLRPQYWEGIEFRWFDTPQPQRPPFVYESISRLMIGYALSLKGDLEERRRQVLATIDDPALKKTMSASLDPKMLATHARNTRASEFKPLSRQTIESLERSFNGDLENPGPANPMQ